MPPSKPACQALAATYRLAGEITDKLSDIKDAVLRIVTLKAQIRFGLIDIADAIGAELIGAVGAVASRVAKNVLGSISKMGSEILERIFSQILKILLAFPTSVFSLVAIPHDSAKKATIRESIYLRRADENLKRILYIILKWTKGKSGSDYRNQMIASLPFIIRAIDLCKDLIHGLRGEPSRPGEFGNNSVFKDDVYKKIKANLSTAINLSKPESVIEQRLEINKRLENDKKRRYNEKASLIKDEYGRRRKSLSDQYRKDIAAAGLNSSDSAPNRLKDAIKEHVATIAYKEGLDNLNTWKNEKLAVADIEAETESLRNRDVWLGAITNVKDQFVLDMKTLQDQLFDMLENIRDAYTNNKLSQLHCNTVYDMRNIISRLIEEMIAYIRGAGNAAGETLSEGVESAQALMEVARDSYEGAVNPGSDLSASEYAITLTKGNGLLIAADSVLDSVVTDSLVDLINSDDVLEAANEEFDEFITELGQIPDWDGERGVWSVNIANSSITPYIQLIADITEMLAKIPILSVRGRDSDRVRVQSLIRGVDKDFKRLKRHNSLVINVLSSYTPYMGSEAGDLMKILSSAGLLSTFATTMSIAALATSIASNFTDQFGDELPNYKNCALGYPDLYADGIILRGSTDLAMNMQDPKLENGFQSELEKSDRDKKTVYLKEEIANVDFDRQFGGPDSNLLGNDVG